MNSNKKCSWCVGDKLYESYHDCEWGFPVHNDTSLFECLVLVTFQSGLSWITILRKRDDFRKAFDNFDYLKIAQYQEEKISSLMSNKGIVKHRLKIEATISNAKSYIEIQKEFGSFNKYIWGYTNNTTIINSYKSANSKDLSEAVCIDLKKRNFKFIGLEVICAYMQAIGIINGHDITCFRHVDFQN